MNIIKFESFKYPDDVVKKYKSISRDLYFVSTIDDDKPYLRNVFVDFDKAFENMERQNLILQNSNRLKEYCIFKSNFKIMSEDEINFEKETKKYNV